MAKNQYLNPSKSVKKNSLKHLKTLIEFIITSDSV